MSTTVKPRQSAIPTPGKPGSRSTPSRSRASSVAGRRGTPTLDVDFVSRAFADAINSNDPANHRTGHAREALNGNLSPGSALPSGRQSVTGRPSSVASSTSAAGSFVQRPRTPTSLRTPGRPSDTIGRSSSRNGRVFDIGDNVRIESLGFEGTLRFLGEIDGKVGIWAGVELRGGFSGKGKNDGSVNGKQYFVCPPNCGVFVSTIKLSMPTVSRATSNRPPSAASSRNGRHTPSISGRPSYPSFPIGGTSTGHMGYPVGGRVTPSQSMNSITTTTTPTHFRPRTSIHSRVSRNVTTSGKQLQSHNLGSPTTPGRDISSQPEFGSASTAVLHRARVDIREGKRNPNSSNGLGEGTSSVASRYERTPHAVRARIPSAIAMPPPPSPTTTALRRSSSAKGGDHFGNGEESPSRRGRVSLASTTSPSPPSSASLGDLNTTSASKDCVLQIAGSGSTSQCGEGDAEEVYTGKRVDDSAEPLDVGRLETDQNRILLTQISHLHGHLQRSEALLVERDSAADLLRQTLLDLQRQKAEEEQRLKDLERQLSENISSYDSLKETLQLREAREVERESILTGKNAKIVVLEAQVKKLNAQAESEKKELSFQVEELRRAGQETIALYEERLNDAERKRFELEDRIAFLEARQLSQSEPTSPGPESRNDSAAQIDNESLRDHVHHLQRKIIALEDKLEEVQTTSENEGMVLREKVKRFKEREESMRKELNQGRKEAEQALNSEASARHRLQEIEEALRENTIALEDARAEVEGLRAELANAGSVVDDDKGFRTSEISDIRCRASKESSRAVDKLSTLHGSAKIAMLDPEPKDQQQRPFSGVGQPQQLPLAAPARDVIGALESRNAELEKLAEERRLEVAKERQIKDDLRQTLTDRTGELDSLRSRLSADSSVSNTLQRSSRMTSNTSQGSLLRNDEAAVRDEITGLKLIVHELQQENSVATQRVKLLEADNTSLRSEIEQLRQELKILEDGFEQSILHEEQVQSPVGDTKVLHMASTEQKTKFEAELEQLGNKLADMEMKNTRLIFESNKEISELETLVEAKIYREDELEAELERTRNLLAQLQKQLSKEMPVSQDYRRHTSMQPHDTVCEICDKPGHDIFTCSLLKEDPKRISPRNGDVHADLFCEDCESHGHIAAECPHSLDVF